MSDLTLTRIAYTEMGVFGEMMVAGQRLYTVERPWLGNTPSVSCIPCGDYICRPRQFYRGGYPAIEVTGVLGRTHILIHKANLSSQLAGCIAPGYRLGTLNGQWAVMDSGKAFDFLMGEYGGREFEFRIAQYVEGCSP